MNKSLLEGMATLTSLAKEAKMATHRTEAKSEMTLLSEQIRAADYMASVFAAKLSHTCITQDAVNYHQCMTQCTEHANELKIQLQVFLDAEVHRKEYIRQSV